MSRSSICRPSWMSSSLLLQLQRPLTIAHHSSFPSFRPGQIENASSVERILASKRWLFADPSARLTTINTKESHTFRILRDDLLHPYISGNKYRKLDGIWPELVARGVKDVVTCGGLQSAHTLAVAAAATDHSMRAHLLVRGERPLVPTGNHLLASMFAHNVVYVNRSDYVDRDAMLSAYVANNLGSAASTAVIPEGASEPSALLGNLRLVHWMANSTSIFPRPQDGARLVIDCGTGTSAIGLALGAALLGLPWQVIGVMLAGRYEYYSEQASRLVQRFCGMVGLDSEESLVWAEVSTRLRWIERVSPRRFGSILPDEIRTCREIASNWGVVVDPIWTLAAWETAVIESSLPGPEVLMIHSGGGLGLCGIAQRYPDQFY